MDWITMLNEIFRLCVVPLLGVLTTYFVNYIRKRSSEIQIETDSEKQRKYIQLLTDTITKCVITTNQTYVDALKNKDAFDEKSQKEAFSKTYEAVNRLLTNEARLYLNNVYADLDEYIRQSIENEVYKLNAAKKAE